ncbi:peptidase YpeB-like protein [Rhodopseudomonas faecalis]|uniref:Peptidase YpeB-like protein n=1 Tax=Rhodopseudomonas faecalis TaxID=99655 RepID=A0A318T848_9BRAD|nr:PepSY domain-containing protein [Rhodopseudomonas faecalis]PYE99088.1 peptidase YpeB-like protein [Rhodopseudomonas faecalis]TAH66444.1 MAG: peptidase [Rhodopseudomonas palustris]
MSVTAGVADPEGARRHWHGHHHDRYDHDAVRDAVERGEIKPLAQLLELVKGRLPGEITGVEIERKQGVWLYEFRVIDKSGRLFDVYVDAQNGEIRRTKEK